MANLRDLNVSGSASFANPPDAPERPIRREEWDAALAAVFANVHAPVTVADSNSIKLALPNGTQALTATLRRKITGLSTVQGLLLETPDGVAVKLGVTNGCAAPGWMIPILQSGIAGKAPLVHGHSLAQVFGLLEALDTKANATHTHAIANVTGLTAALNGKAPADHNHGNATPTSSGFMSGEDKARLNSLATTGAGLWLDPVPTRDYLPLNVDPLNAVRFVTGEGKTGAFYRHKSVTGLLSDQWEKVGTAKDYGFIGVGGSALETPEGAIDYVHGLATMDVTVSVRRASGTQRQVDMDWAPVDANTIRLFFDTSPPASGSLRITVVG